VRNLVLLPQIFAVIASVVKQSRDLEITGLLHFVAMTGCNNLSCTQF